MQCCQPSEVTPVRPRLEQIGQLNKAGIKDIEKHFKTKTVRVTGTISKHEYRGKGTPSEVEIVIDDLSRLKVVD